MGRFPRGSLAAVWLGLFAAARGFEVPASEPWWHTYTPVATINQREEGIETIQPGAARGGTGTLGWYGFWFLDEQNKSGVLDACRKRLEQAGVKKVLYYDVGEVGDFAGFFTPDGRMKHTGWSLPWWNQREPLIARWVGLKAFFRDVPWAPYPTAKAYGLPAFTTPDGQPADDLYGVLTRRGLDDRWHWQFSSNARITDEIAERGGLAKISAKQASRADVQNQTGWRTVRLVDVDFANPQLSAYCCRELAHLVAKLRPDGIHADNLGDNNLGHADAAAFGSWSRHGFREFLQRRLSPDERKAMGVSDPASFDIAAYVREKPFESRGLRWHSQNPKWTNDPVWLCYLIHKVESALAYHRAIYAGAKKAAREQGLDCAVFGNAIPLPLGGSLLRGACDIAHFEWSTVHGWWGMKPMGLPPEGRVGYVTRLGAAMSDAPFCWPSIYVSKDFSGAGHEQLHKVIAFDCLANRGLLDFGHWYLDGYSPGTPASAGFVNRFVRAHRATLSRRYAADVAVVHSAWSEIASCTVFNPVMDQFVDEYCGWCRYLGDTHRQWTVLLQDDLTAERLAEHPVVVLPSVMVLTDAQIEHLRRYSANGGRLVATGRTGSRHGPDRFLSPRPGPFEVPRARVVADKPGVAYWCKSGEAAAGRRMAELLDWSGFRPRLETDAPATVGVNLNLGTDPSDPVMTLDLNNCDISAAGDTIRPAPPCAVTVRLPDAWRGRGASVRYATPELPPGDPPVPLGGDAVDLDPAAGTLRLRTPSFSTFLLVFIRPS